MATYLMLSTLTDEGCATIRKNPDRILEVNSEVEAMGGRIISQYALLGDADFATIVEAPDEGAAVKISLNLCSRGTVRIKTIPAVGIQDFIGGIK